MALKLVSFVVIVTVINVVLEVTLSLALLLVERKGIAVVVAVVERKLVVVLAAVTAMVRCGSFNLRMIFQSLCGCRCVTQLLVHLMVDTGVFPLV